MQSELDNPKQWSDNNLMRLNPTKCNFMTVCFQWPPVKPQFHIDNLPINTCLKLLGVYVQENLKWDTQIDFMCKSFNCKLYFLRQPKRCNVSVCDLRLVYRYILYIRPVIEYASPVCFSRLTKKQLECLEKLQKKAFRIILSYDYCMNYSYQNICDELNISPISQRLERLFLNFGTSLLSSNRFREWLPLTRNNNLRNVNLLTTVKCRTNRYKNSCIPSLIQLMNK